MAGQLDPEKYDAWYDRPFGKRAHSLELEMILKVLGDLQTKRVLEIGCGTGRFTIPISPLCNSLMAVDSSVRMIGYAHQRMEASDGLAHFILADAHQLPFRPNSFDAVFSVATLCSVANLEKVVDEVLRVTKIGGMIVDGELNRRSAYYFDKLLREKLSGASSVLPIRFFTPKEFADLWKVPIWKSCLFAWESLPSSLLKEFGKIDSRLSRILPSFGAFMVIRKIKSAMAG